MAFLTRTRLVQIATGTEAAKVMLDPPTVFRTSAVGQVVETVAEAMALVPAGQRPAANTWWRYIVQWEVRSHVVPDIKGVIPETGFLVVDADFWETQADRVASLPPARRNTFVHQFTTKQLAGAGPIIRASIDDYLIRAHFGNFPPDGRAAVATTADPARDPLGLMGRQAITDLDGVPIDLPARWRGAEG